MINISCIPPVYFNIANLDFVIISYINLHRQTAFLNNKEYYWQHLQQYLIKPRNRRLILLISKVAKCVLCFRNIGH